MFVTEVFRNSKNTAKIAFEDLRAGLATKNNKQVLSGLRRLTAAATTMTATPIIVNQLNSANNITNEQKTLIGGMMPSWGQGSSVVFLEPFIQDETVTPEQIKLKTEQKAEELRKSGEFPKKSGESEEAWIARSISNSRPAFNPDAEVRTRFLLTGAVDPYEAIRRPINLLLARYANGEGVSNEELDNTWKNLAESVAGQFVSPKLLTEGLIGAVSGMDPRTGRSITNAADSTVDQIKERVLYLASKFEPQTSVNIRKYLDALSSEEIMGIGQGQKENGFPLNSNDLLTSMTLGVRPQTVNLNKSISYKLYNYSKNVDEIEKGFTRQVTSKIGSGVPYTKEIHNEILEQYREALARQREVVQKMSKFTSEVTATTYTRKYIDESGKVAWERDKRMDLNFIRKAVTNSGFFGSMSDTQKNNLINTLVEDDKKVFVPKINMRGLQKSMLASGLSVREVQALIYDMTRIQVDAGKIPLLDKDE